MANDEWRMTDLQRFSVFVIHHSSFVIAQLRGYESNVRLQGQGLASLPAATTPEEQFGEKGSNLHKQLQRLPAYH